MTLAEIKAAVDRGQTVQWANAGYRVIKDRLGQYLVIYMPNGSAIGLTDRLGDRLNGQEADFFVPEADHGPLAEDEMRVQVAIVGALPDDPAI